MTPRTLPRYAAIYCRLSYAPDGSLEKVERQEGDCRALGKQLDWGICCVYSDNNKSAWKKNRKRKDWDALLASFQPDAVCPRGNRHDGILTYHGDRLIRQPWDLELLLKVADDRHLPLASPQATRDLNSEDDRFILRIEVAQACRASADTSRRVHRANAARVDRGESASGANRPFGYGIPTGEEGVTGRPLYDLNQIVPEEAEYAREAIRRLLAGQTQGGVIAWLNRVTTTTTGGKWTPSGFRQWLSMPRIAGLIEYGGSLHPAAWEPIIPLEDWEDLKALIKDRTEQFPSHGRERVYLLTGHGRCGSCSGPLWTKPVGKNPNARQYFCKNPDCPKRVSRNVRLLDEYMIGHTLRLLNDPALLDALYAESDTPGVGAEIAALERRKAEIMKTIDDLANQPDVDPALLARLPVSFDRKIKQLRDQLSVSTSQRLLAKMAGVTREQWDREPIDVRAETVRTLFRVTVLPNGRRGPGFDPSSVRVVRRESP